MNTTPTSTTDDTLPHHGSCDDFCNFSDRRAIQDIPVESVLLQENVALATWTHRMVGSMIQTTRNQESRRVISEKKRRIKRSLFSSESTTPSQESCHLLVSLSRHPSTSTFIWLLIWWWSCLKFNASPLHLGRRDSWFHSKPSMTTPKDWTTPVAFNEAVAFNEEKHHHEKRLPHFDHFDSWYAFHVRIDKPIALNTQMNNFHSLCIECVVDSYISLEIPVIRSCSILSPSSLLTHVSHGTN